MQCIINKKPNYSILLKTSNPTNIIFASETWLQSGINTCEILLSSYQVYRKDLATGHGGVLLAIHHEYITGQIHIIDDGSEVVRVKLSLADKLGLVIIAACRPTDNNLDNNLIID